MKTIPAITSDNPLTYDQIKDFSKAYRKAHPDKTLEKNNLELLTIEMKWAFEQGFMDQNQFDDFMRIWTRIR